MPRLVRRAPLRDRILAYLDPVEFFLWLSEELNSNGWDEQLKNYSVPLAIVLHLVFLVSHAYGADSFRSGDNYVFEDERPSFGFGFGLIFLFISNSLAFLSLLNAIYTFTRKRHYRLFEAPLDLPPSTPSARRVRVDSSPLASSPLRYLASVLNSVGASDMAGRNPYRSDHTRTRFQQQQRGDVWEIAVWDPTPMCLRMFCLFSPGHIILYYLLLPARPRTPATTADVICALLLSALLALQLSWLASSFAQQAKDTALVHKEVLNEYDTKFVHPSLRPLVRDVGVQCGLEDATSRHSRSGNRQYSTPPNKSREVDTYTPTVILSRGFRPNPNPAYAAQYDPDNAGRDAMPHRRTSFGPTAGVPAASSYQQPGGQFRTPQGQLHLRQPPSRPPVGTSGMGDGGSLGVFSHASSPLKKAASAQGLRDRGGYGYEQGHSYKYDGVEERRGHQGGGKRREGSPLKRMSTPSGAMSGAGAEYERGNPRSGYLRQGHGAGDGRR
ncbi:hypothetical protein BDY21DRAFT_290162 [Lineolata rhizophorae]|uniref:Nuclear rim protein 1 n=1 Tax=Lineolata rhizophorae TaxID=578093 RepID=A0A6A6NTZ1_9PEZI|nr:hypothetical protein BDY21DRAFT_290162 [Lineolata rhizophorae]